MFKLICFVSYVLRTLYGPNPFEYLPNGAGLNILFGFVLVPITYLTVGMFYHKGSAPVVGSIAFLVMYFVNGYVFQQIMRFYPYWWLIVILSIAYIFVVAYIVNRIKYSD